MAMTEFRLYGSLGARYGRVHRLECNTPAEGLSGLMMRCEGLTEFLLTAHLDDIYFKVRKRGHDMAADELQHAHGSRIITIAPVTVGAKSGLIQAIAGIALVVASFYTGGLATAGILSASMASSLGAGLFSTGIALTLGGVMQMLSPQPGLQVRQDPDNKPSYAFGGPVNTTTQGNPVAILYGEREIGGQIISASIVAEDTNG